MVFKNIQRSILLGALTLFGAHAGAASISIVAISAPDLTAGSVLEAQILMDFSDDPTLGGGFDLQFSDGLQFLSYTSNALGDPAFSRSPDVFAGLLSGFAFGDFGGLTGPAVVGTVTFELTALAGAGISVQLGPNLSGIGGPFVSAIDNVSIIDVQYQGFEIQPIPVPAAVWLFGAALAALAPLGSRRRR